MGKATPKAPSNDHFSTNDFTVQCWFNTDKSGSLFKDYSSNFSITVLSNRVLQFVVKNGDQISGIQSEKTGLNDGFWHQLTAVRSANNLSLFLNGEFLWVSEVESPVISSENVIEHIEQISFWKNVLTESEIRDTFINPAKGNEKGLLKVKSSASDENKLLKKSDVSNTPASLSVYLRLRNDSDKILKKAKAVNPNRYYKQFPDQIPPHEEIVIELSNEGNAIWSVISCSVAYENISGSIVVNVNKSQDQYDSSIFTLDERDLISEVSTVMNNQTDLVADVVMSESLVVVNMRNVYNFLSSLEGKINRDQIEAADGNLIDVIRYNKACQIFNTRLQLKPFVIVYCKTAGEVQLVFNNAKSNNLEIRLRSGGHDHEGECTGTDTIVIDFTRMNSVNLVTKNNETYVHIGPGISFKDLTTQLAVQGVMIPHGTCATVGIAGFTMGGGWGPWTRIAGMCCESLVGATIVLGDGEIVKLDTTNGESVPNLLWALRGGGGMSYGIVTELVIKTFPLPNELIKFEVEWNSFTSSGKSKTKTPTINVLKSWETIIKSQETIQLIGTNLKISAKPWPYSNYDKFDENTIDHNCIIYGYWNGSQKMLEEFLKVHYSSVPNYEVRIDGIGGSQKNYGLNLMSSWDRESFYNVQRIADGKKSKPLPPDLDQPSPHKITSRLVDAQGLGQKGYRALLMSLTSNLLSEENRTQGLFTYITLGAITGKFYQTINPQIKTASAFPYKDKLYTIQYQTWWNEKLTAKEKGQDNEVYVNTNRALDWMQVCRDFEIPNTSGAFISFKDSSVPTKTYFGDSYDRLKQIKINFSKDPLNHFRTRKTII